jgi:hypothetical protein
MPPTSQNPNYPAPLGEERLGATLIAHDSFHS